VGPHRRVVLVPLLGRFLPHRALHGGRDPLDRRRPPQPGAPLPLPHPRPLHRPHLLRHLHLALAPVPVDRQRPHRVDRLPVVRAPVGGDPGGLGAVLPPGRAAHPHGDLPRPVAGLGGRARRRRRRRGGCHGGHGRDLGRGQHDRARWSPGAGAVSLGPTRARAGAGRLDRPDAGARPRHQVGAGQVRLRRLRPSSRSTTSGGPSSAPSSPT
jgi:hypothetical protein